MNKTIITIGELSKQSGVATSAIRFYESQKLISSTRTVSGRRQYRRETLRRIAFIRVAQAVGLNLCEIRVALNTLPGERTPTQQDWERLARAWQPMLQQRIDALIALRDQLVSCAGCGCLSLKFCSLYSAEDVPKRGGSGSRNLDVSHDVLVRENTGNKEV